MQATLPGAAGGRCIQSGKHWRWCLVGVGSGMQLEEVRSARSHSSQSTSRTRRTIYQHDTSVDVPMFVWMSVAWI
eukprot:5887257-Lingulodinium_polyedra.AAC.1